MFYEISLKSQYNYVKYPSRELECIIPLDEKWWIRSADVMVEVIANHLEKTSNSNKWCGKGEQHDLLW